MGHHSSPTHPPPLTGGAGTGRSMLSKLSFLLLCGESLPLVQVRHRCRLTSGAITSLQQTMTHPSYDRSFVHSYKRRRVQDRTRMTSLEATMTNRHDNNENNATPRHHCHRRRIDDRRFNNGYKSHRMSTNFLYMANNNDIDSTSGDGFGKDENSDNSKHDKKKKKASGSSNNSSASGSSGGENSSPKQQQQQSRAAKSVNKDEPSAGRKPSGAYKGASISSNSNDNNNTKNHNSGHPRSKSNSSDNNNSNSKKANNDGAKSTPMTNVKKSNSSTTNNNNNKKKDTNNNSIVSKGSGSSIKSSDKNTSLTGFKSSATKQQQPRQLQQQQQQQQNQEGSSSNSGGNSKSKNIVPNDGSNNNNNNSNDSINTINENDDRDVTKRIIQLETIVSAQMTEIQKLRREIDNLTKGAALFTQVVDVLRNAGIQIDEDDNVQVGVVDIDNNDDDDEVDDDDDENDTTPPTKRISPTTTVVQQKQKQITFNDDLEIFGITPKSVTDAADTAGASMLSAILAGKHRMLVDVRDAELTRDPKLLVEFIELAILPVAAGLEGLDYVRNRVKIVFPTVRELMSYRKLMALAAPEVVSLSTLGFEPVDERDNLIVVIAPSPDDVAGVAAMEKLIARTDKNYVEPQRRILQPVVVMNHHMVPVDMAGFAGQFTTVYHLRLLSVQYMTGDAKEPEFVKANPMSATATSIDDEDESSSTDDEDDDEIDEIMAEKVIPGIAWNETREEEEALEAAMTHAHEIGFHQGVTRAMVIRAYPKPWHVFVDTSPDTDADFEVAATFDTEPTQEDVNYAIVECLEGSEREDEIVAQQMQAALEAGQLNRVSEMLGISPSDMVSSERTFDTTSDTDTYKPYQEYDGKDWDDLYYDDWFSEDSV